MSGPAPEARPRPSAAQEAAPPPSECQLAPATVEDTEELTRIAHLAKAHWGYPEAWLAAWREELTLRPSDLSHLVVSVARRPAPGSVAGEILGFYALADQDTRWSLEHLWVRPRVMGRGIGRLLFADAIRSIQARRPAGTRLLVDSDPHAAGFYVKMGCLKVGSVRADMGVSRTRPLFEYQVQPIT